MNTVVTVVGRYRIPAVSKPLIRPAATTDAHTPEGTFKVYREYTDGWESGQLGELYRPKYFKGGVAVHGAPQIPNRPVSHGCVRVSTSAMDWIWASDLLPVGTRVVVHA